LAFGQIYVAQKDTPTIKPTFILFCTKDLVKILSIAEMMQLLTQHDLTKIFNISVKAITVLVHTGKCCAHAELAVLEQSL